MIVFGPGQFTFLPQGTNLTFVDARALPSAPPVFRAQVLSHLRAYAGTHPSPALLLKQLGFLLATAPLTPGAKAAAWTVLSSLGGLHRCGTGTDLTGRRGQSICANSRQYGTELLIDPQTASVLSVEERLAKPSPAYPGLPTQTLIQSDTFTSQP